MKVMLMTDMEGVAGVLNFEDWTRPEGRYYEKGKRFLTAEVNAAIEGLCANGIEEVLVVDGHGAGGVDPELLDERAQLMRGAPAPVWPWGLDESFDGLGVIGQHAKAGTPYSHLTHTQSCAYADLDVNGISIGEYGQLSLCARQLGVPTFLACGEKAFIEEAEALTLGVITAWGKRGLLPDGLEDMDLASYRRAKLSAVHFSPKESQGRIHEAAEKAAIKLKSDPSSFHYPDLQPPYVRTIRLRPDEDHPARVFRDTHPDSFIELMNMSWTPLEETTG
ncbi:MAG: M55 family metallopeptidase [Candidatus Brocadiia bacterium]